MLLPPESKDKSMSLELHALPTEWWEVALPQGKVPDLQYLAFEVIW